MTDEEFLIKLREAFTVEAQEHLQAITSGLLDLEAGPTPERRQELIETTFREAHSLKGAARAVSRTDVETLCQEMEGIFSEWKDHAPAVSAEQYDVLNRTVDLVSKLLAMPEVAQSPSDTDAIAELVAQLRSGPSSNGNGTGNGHGHIHSNGNGNGVARIKVRAKVKAPSPVTPPPVEAPASSADKIRKVRKAAPAPIASAPVPAQPSPEADKPQVAETIRVSMVKMDSLLLQAEEMIAVKLTAGQHTTDLRELEGTFDTWRTRWARVRDITRQNGTALNGAKGREVHEFIEWNHGFITSLEKRVAALARSARQDERAVGSLVDELLSDAKKLVMLPCSTVLDFLAKPVRDLAREEGKEVELVIHGREVELDKRILEEMKPPLIHLVRNAVDHGIETPAERLRTGKPERSTLTIRVSQAEGNKVLIVVSDDGKGIQASKLKASAVKQGVLSAEDAARLPDQEALSLIFQSGVSTSPIVTEVSGRGLGMAIVREKVVKLGGTVTIESNPGSGTTFRILLPVTLATFKGILVKAGGQTFVLPVSSAERIKRFRRDEIKTVEGRETVDLDGRAVAFARLADVLALPKRDADPTQAFVESVVLGTGEGRVAFGVDAVVNEQEVLVKNLGRPLVRVRNVAAATVLGSGTPVLILNAGDLLKSAVTSASTMRAAPTTDEAKNVRANHILVADDSVTSRMLIKNILETSGYEVETATDGMEALTALRCREFDLLVSDVEMPRMTGFELTTNVRADKKLAEMPVVLVTALSSREDRERGIDAGASAYIVKSSFDQSDLLSVIGNLI